MSPEETAAAQLEAACTTFNDQIEALCTTYGQPILHPATGETATHSVRSTADASPQLRLEGRSDRQRVCFVGFQGEAFEVQVGLQTLPAFLAEAVTLLNDQPHADA